MMKKEFGMSILLYLLPVMVTLSSCSTYSTRGELDETARAYSIVVRWKQFETADLFAASSIRDEFEKRVKAAKEVEVMDYEIIDVEYDEAKKKATVNAKISYSTRSSNRVRSLVDKQIWMYEEQKGSKGWRLTTLLPEFK
jgi:hypothetical protein